MAPTIAPTIHHREPTSLAARHATRRRSRRGLTLVEMMVSVTITLLVVFAIVQIFDIMGNTVAMGRATIEMAGQLRSVSNTLQQDLDNLTCPVEPWIDPDQGVGYFEYIEGPVDVALTAGSQLEARSSDRDPLAITGSSSEYDPDNVTKTVYGDNNFQVFGDVDDILAMTVRSSGEPFVGRAPSASGSTTVESHVAEVVWWMALYDTNGNGSPDLNDSPLLLRRVLLVRPDLDLSSAPDHRQFFYDFDISARFDSSTTKMLANSLGDLSERANRFAHEYGTPAADPTEPPDEFPFEMVLYVPNDPTTSNDDGMVDQMVNDAPEVPFLFEHEQPLAVYLDAYPVPDLSNSENYEIYSSVLPRFISQEAMATWSDFVVLSDVTGFDVRMFDGDALGILVAGNALTPSDAQYAGEVTRHGSAEGAHYLVSWSLVADAVADGRIFRGTFVDLGFHHTQGTSPPDAVRTVLGDQPEDASVDFPWSFVCFDTWPLTYERDGINQDYNDGDVNIDEGFNGIDDPVDPQSTATENGVDDLSERETAPPYNVTPMGIEVRIRMLEFGTGQVRQVSVVGDFTK